MRNDARPNKILARLFFALTWVLLFLGNQGCGTDENALGSRPSSESSKQVGGATPSLPKQAEITTGPTEQGREKERINAPGGKASGDRDGSGSVGGGGERAGEADGSDEKSERKKKGELATDLDEARDLRTRATTDEALGQTNGAYRKALEAWNLARAHTNAPDAMALVESLRTDLDRIRNKLNASAGTVTPNKTIRVR